MAQYPMTIQALHGFVDALASRDPFSQGFVGPVPISSHFLGDKPYSSDQSSNHDSFPIMVRCVYPPDTQSRHAVICIKLSMSEKALASKLYEVFDLKPTRGIIKSSVIVLVKELWTFSANGPPFWPPVLILRSAPAILVRHWKCSDRPSVALSNSM